MNTITDINSKCKNCFLRTYQQLFEKFNINNADKVLFLSYFNKIFDENQYKSPPEIQRDLNRAFCEILKIDDPFAEEKILSNHIALSLYDYWKPKVMLLDNPFDLALRLSIAGNIMDYGANNSFDIHKTIEYVLHSSFAINHSELLRERINKAKRVLYLGDNAGEIVFDRLFIETVLHNEVFYAVKSVPVLNDATMVDAKYTGMNHVAHVISNGYDAPSTLLSKSSKAFIDIYNSADLLFQRAREILKD